MGVTHVFAVELVRRDTKKGSILLGSETHTQKAATTLLSVASGSNKNYERERSVQAWRDGSVEVLLRTTVDFQILTDGEKT